MKGEADVIESLNAIGYDGNINSEKALTQVVKDGPKSEAFREFITWLANEVHVLGNTDEKITNGTDFNEFMLEMSGLLKEMGCPYSQFVTGPLTGRLQSRESRMLILDYLLTEIMALKMCLKAKPEENSYIIPVFESSTARALVSITKELSLGKPPDNIAPKTLMDKIANRLDETIKKINSKKLSQPLFKPKTDLTDIQWKKLADLQKELDQEYNLRREMLLTRLDVTVQSFQWTEKIKGKEENIIKRYQNKKQELDQLQLGDMGTDIAALLAAREDLAIIEKTSNANVRKNTASKIQKHVIGRVPDRGGRAYEHAPPPPEMPSWQQNRATGPQGGGNRGGGRGGGGGGNWGQPKQQRSGHQNQQHSPRQQFNQQHQSNQYNQNPQFGQNQHYNQNQQQYEQRQQFNNQGGYGSGNRVQGGWSQRGSSSGQVDNYGGGNQYNNNQGGGGGGNYGGRQGGDRGGGDRGGRGRSNYNRGGNNGSGYWR